MERGSIYMKGKLKQIDAGHDYMCTGLIAIMTYLPGKLTDLEVGVIFLESSPTSPLLGGMHEVFGVNETGQIFHCKRPCVGE